MLYQVTTNKYSHEGSAFERVEMETPDKVAAILRADEIRPFQRWATVVEVENNLRRVVYISRKVAKPR